VCSPRIDLKEVPLDNPEYEIFVDGSASHNKTTGANEVGFAVVSPTETLVSGSLPTNYSAQAAELVALTEACKYAKGPSANIYTDSRYTFGVVHDFGTLWKQRGFLTSTGKYIAHHNLMSQLLDAVLLPKTVAIIKCQAHTNGNDFISKGNASADAVAKAAAQQYFFNSSHSRFKIQDSR